MRVHMKIYFGGSIRGGDEDREIYHILIGLLQQFAEVLTEHVGDPALTDQGESTKADNEIFQRDITWIREVDVIVAEVTVPSLGVGYELGIAESFGKPVICLYREKNGRQLSAMIAGNPRFQVEIYHNVDEAIELVRDFIQHRVPREH